MTRSEIIEKRKALSDAEVKHLSFEAQNRLCAMECFKMAKSVMLYIPIENETATYVILSRCIAKKVYAPRITGDGEMVAADISDGMKKGKFGIEEPVGRDYDSNIDLYVVPGVIFSENGARVGRGKGYYDRFLAGKRGVKIGLCYSFQMQNDIQMKNTDIFMDFVVNDKGVYMR